MRTQAATKAELDRALFARVGKRYLSLETDLVHSAIEYLSRVLGFQIVERRNVGALDQVQANGKHRKVFFGKAGMADVWAIAEPSGTLIEIELKTPGKEPTALQADWLRRVQHAGGIALWATSLPELARKLQLEFERKGLVWKANWNL